MDRGERRRIRKRKIKQRMNKAKHFIPAWVYNNKSAEEIFDTPGYFSNNNEMNKYANCGCAKKSNTCNDIPVEHISSIELQPPNQHLRRCGGGVAKFVLEIAILYGR